MRKSRNLFTILFFLIVASTASAQKETGAIVGDVMGEEQPLPGATITVSSTDLIGGSSVAITDAGGHYRFPALAPGVYQVKAELSGFQTVIRNDMRLFCRYYFNGQLYAHAAGWNGSFAGFG